MLKVASRRTKPVAVVQSVGELGHGGLEVDPVAGLKRLSVAVVRGHSTSNARR